MSRYEIQNLWLLQASNKQIQLSHLASMKRLDRLPVRLPACLHTLCPLHSALIAHDQRFPQGWMYITAKDISELVAKEWQRKSNNSHVHCMFIMIRFSYVSET